MRPKLNFPTYQFNIKPTKKGDEIYDEFRKDWFLLTPEEWVRQNTLKYLVDEKGFPKSLLVIEKAIKVNNLLKRFDALLYDNRGIPRILIECKAPNIKITEAVFNQIANYNTSIKADFLLVTNGLNHVFCSVNHEKKSVEFLKTIPNYKSI